MNYVTKTMIISVFTNIFLAVTKIIFGFIAHSSALIADGIHSFSDLSTDFFAIKTLKSKAWQLEITGK